ncbi:MAG TPA: hypothetical protein VNV41_05790 [Candidatus Acidoferrales bacterium]|jgi:hypothetical protein|nr:hypothetical protein [Candidatus Acidoferrales bacterium]
MRISRPALLLLLCVLIPASLSAQQSTSTPAATSTSDPQAVAAAQGALRALAGSANVNDVTLTGTANRIAGSDNESGTVKLEAMAGGYSKVTLGLPSGPYMEIRNPSGTPLPSGTSAGVPSPATGPQPVGAWSGADGVLHGMAVHNLLTDATWFFPALTLGRLALSPAFVLSYIGQETYEGQNVLHVSACLGLSPGSNNPPYIVSLVQHLSRMDLYLDPATLLPVALAFDTHLDDNFSVDIAIEIRFSNYQTLNGVEVPYRVRKYQNNGLVLDLQLSNATLNSGLAVTAFEIQ